MKPEVVLIDVLSQVANWQAAVNTNLQRIRAALQERPFALFEVADEAALLALDPADYERCCVFVGDSVTNAGWRVWWSDGFDWTVLTGSMQLEPLTTGDKFYDSGLVWRCVVPVLAPSAAGAGSAMNAAHGIPSPLLQRIIRLHGTLADSSGSPTRATAIPGKTQAGVDVVVDMDATNVRLTCLGGGLSGYVGHVIVEFAT